MRFKQRSAVNAANDLLENLSAVESNVGGSVGGEGVFVRRQGFPRVPR